MSPEEVFGTFWSDCDSSASRNPPRLYWPKEAPLLTRVLERVKRACGDRLCITHLLNGEADRFMQPLFLAGVVFRIEASRQAQNAGLRSSMADEERG